jgi:HK97 family phage major capsid protein
LDKDPTTGAYLAPPSFSNAAGNQIGPVRVIPNPLMPQGQFLVGDFNRAILRIREELGVQLGFENDDFTRNLITIVMEMRAVHYIKSNHIQAFRKGVFATAKTAINKP